MSDDTQVVEKRIKSTIIRRRKEVVETPVPTAEEIAAQEAEAKKAAIVETAPAVVSEEQKVNTSEIVAPQVPQAPQAPTPSKPGLVIKGMIDLSKIAGATRTSVTGKPTAPSKLSPVAAVDPLSLVVGTDEEEEAKKKHKKAAKKKEGGIEVDIEGVERVASMTQLTRLAHVERVFQPSRTVKRKKIISRKGLKQTPVTITRAEKRVVDMGKSISVGRLADEMGVKASAVIAKLMNLGVMATINQEVDFDTAQIIAQEFQFEVRDISFNEQKIIAEQQKGGEEKLVFRPPVVTIMGHVDHGKTSLLDAIRETSVAAGEAGGITQHIGAYTVQLPKGQITFLDTPGHEAFAAMRARGAAVTDIVILVVAADDGIMPQTLESIHHAKAAGVPIVVAVNKIDKPEANLERIKRQLADHELSPEEWGGQTQYAYVSAKQKSGLDDLLEKILLQAEVLELKADPTVMAQGTILESKLDKGRGPVATLLVRQGTLRQGDVLVAGGAWGKVRAMINYRGEAVSEAGPSVAVEIQGLSSVPNASDQFHVVKDDQAAKEIAEHRTEQIRQTKLSSQNKVSLEDLFSKIQAGDIKELTMVLKTDVHGSLEAVTEAIRKLGTDKVAVKIIHSGVGGISESDVLLASASKAIIVGFNVRPETSAIKLAQNEGVEIKLYKIM